MWRPRARVSSVKINLSQIEVRRSNVSWLIYMVDVIGVEFFLRFLR